MQSESQSFLALKTRGSSTGASDNTAAQSMLSVGHALEGQLTPLLPEQVNDKPISHNLSNDTYMMIQKHVKALNREQRSKMK